MINVEQLYRDQVAFYKGKEYKAWLSLAPDLREFIPKPDKTYRYSPADADWIRYRNQVRRISRSWQDRLGLKLGDNQLDHIVPVMYGFRRGIPAHLIGGIQNLQYLTKKQNAMKGAILFPEALALCAIWGYLPTIKEEEYFKQVKYLH